ncbi:hypothetical protein D8674_035672 [Pyrus ussuriensis x Pyrus communis]|uniref:Uncharacterized protein n=1 Tax=Pyrus ussuriensis x Pyrus communis TaxID=2448454 RepID=A0A5N5GD21_9ROSA|nr:hypothetical protein D8674_035672 [Pyrus ussuriensis x Pyrus communis]
MVLHVNDLAPMLKIFFPSYMKQILGMQKRRAKIPDSEHVIDSTTNLLTTIKDKIVLLS